MAFWWQNLWGFACVLSRALGLWIEFHLAVWVEPSTARFVLFTSTRSWSSVRSFGHDHLCWLRELHWVCTRACSSTSAVTTVASARSCSTLCRVVTVSLYSLGHQVLTELQCRRVVAPSFGKATRSTCRAILSRRNGAGCLILNR